jgi:predicted Zn-dependent protease
MSKIGRNSPCPCHSGKKYKHCCLTKDEAAQHQHASCKCCGYVATDDDREVDRQTEAIMALVRRGRLDDAERAAHELARRFPDAVAGPDLLGLVCLERGDRKQAATYFRQVAALMGKLGGYRVQDQLDVIMRANDLDPREPAPGA